MTLQSFADKIRFSMTNGSIRKTFSCAQDVNRELHLNQGNCGFRFVSNGAEIQTPYGNAVYVVDPNLPTGVVKITDGQVPHWRVANAEIRNACPLTC